MVVCAICLVKKEAVDMQMLSCAHAFCRECMTHCTASQLCPAPFCTYVRRVNVVIDEADEMLSCAHAFCRECMTHCTASQLCPAPFCTYVRRVNVVIDEADEGSDDMHQKMKVGPQLPSMLQLEERQRCDGRKEELPYCPIFLCANRLTTSEIAKVIERQGHLRKVCAGLIAKAPEAPPEEPPGKDECVLFCSVYHSEGSVKPITFPTACTVLDMVTAMIQVQHLKKYRTAHNIGVFIKVSAGGTQKYDPFEVKPLGKKKICDAEIHNGTHFVLDVDCEIKQVV